VLIVGAVVFAAVVVMGYLDKRKNEREAEAERKKADIRSWVESLEGIPNNLRDSQFSTGWGTVKMDVLLAMRKNDFKNAYLRVDRSQPMMKDRVSLAKSAVAAVKSVTLPPEADQKLARSLRDSLAEYCEAERAEAQSLPDFHDLLERRNSKAALEALGSFLGSSGQEAKSRQMADKAKAGLLHIPSTSSGHE
jgi:flagellar basal body-associated protein FliL